MIRKSVAVLLLILAAMASFAQIPAPSNPPKLVNDFADVLNNQFEQQLEQELVAFNDSTSNQITVVTVPSLNGMDPAMMASQIGEEWKVGQKEFDNGVVILFKPKQANSKGEVFIAVGKGLEGAIPDAIANRIVENEMIPMFKQKRTEQGLYNAVVVLKQLAAGEITAKGYAKKKKNKAPVAIPFFILAVIIFIVLSKVQQARRYSLGHDVPFWTALFLANAATRRHNGYYSNFNSGGGSFGGGGGFGGFGGGGFGGGGAGGSW